MKSASIVKIAVILLFLIPSVSTAGQGKNVSGKGRYESHHGDRDYRRGGDDRGTDRYSEHRGYNEYRGYKEHPYDRGRHYGHYKHNRREYEYRGHWRSWDDWDRYARKHPRIYEHGHYYRENAHLMFRFCDPGGGGCFFFSIGR